MNHVHEEENDNDEKLEHTSNILAVLEQCLSSLVVKVH